LGWFIPVMPDEPDPPRKTYQLGKAEFKPLNPAPETTGAAAPDQDVQAHLRDNLARAKAAGVNELEYRPRRISRRRRDYWTLFFLGNGGFGAAMLYFGPQTLGGVFALAAMIFYSAALTWVMFGVMSDY
jgi:hypothetical protein